MNNFYYASVAPNYKPSKKQERKLNLNLNPHAQRLIRELAVVNRIQNSVFHANQFDLVNFKLRLVVEEEGVAA